MNELPPGHYRHFKGNEYTVLGVARHSETLEELVVYRQEYGDRSLWVRPRPMFTAMVQHAGNAVPRFAPRSTAATDEPAPTNNLFTGLPAHLPSELFTTLLEAGAMRLERIVSHGHASPEGFWYDQEQHEWVVVLSGAARLRFEGADPINLKPGDCVNIPAHKRHRVDWTTPDEPTIWLAVHY